VAHRFSGGGVESRPVGWASPTKTRAFAFALVACVTVLAPPAQTADAPKCSDAQIDALIDQLGDQSYDVRTDATRELISCGPKAVEALREAAREGDLEITVRAKALLEVFEQLLFAGIDIELRASKTSVAWNEPIDLVLTLRNATTHSVNVPFSLPLSGDKDDPPYLTQCTRMLDIADFLEVVGPSEQPVDLKVDDVNQDERLRAALDVRADDPPVGRLDPAQSIEYAVGQFNRGWARYPLLNQGDYRLRLVYQPEWNEDELNRAGVGRVESNSVNITVTKAAPESVRTSHAPARLVLERDGDRISARLQNLDDLPIHVNTLVATQSAPPAARLQWFAVTSSERTEVNINPEAPKGDAFTRAKIVAAEPGEMLELGNLSVAQLAPADEHETPGTANPVIQLQARYINVTGIEWQRRNTAEQIGNPRAPDALRTMLPFRMLVTTLESEPIRITPPK